MKNLCQDCPPNEGDGPEPRKGEPCEVNGERLYLCASHYAKRMTEKTPSRGVYGVDALRWYERRR